MRHNPYIINVLADCDRLYSNDALSESSAASSFMSFQCPSPTARSPNNSPCDSAVGSKPAAKKPNTIADHYKTRLCKNFAAKGSCTYECFCRFAHGPSDLRTYAQNVRTGLTTEEAVRDYQRMLFLKGGYVETLGRSKMEVNHKA